MLFRRSKSSAEPHAVAWPAINARAFMYLSCCDQAHGTRVEDESGTGLVIATPTHLDGSPVAAPPSERVHVILSWASESDMCEVAVTVAAKSTSPLPTWTVAAAGKIKKTQRRRFVRVPVDLDLEVFINGGARYKLSAHDISEGGFRASADSFYLSGDPDGFLVKLELWNAPMLIDARFAWKKPARGTTSEVGIEFVNPDEKVKDAIRSYVFSLQRKHLASQRGD